MDILQLVILDDLVTTQAPQQRQQITDSQIGID